MTFADLLDRMGGMGRFQILHITLLVVPVLLTASHNLLQNFSAAVPEHHCRVRLTDNDTERHANWTRGLGSEEELLWVSIPKDEAGKPEKCRRFATPQWHLLGSNATDGNLTQTETEPCHDGWIYDRSIFTNTIIMEVSKKTVARMSPGQAGLGLTPPKASSKLNLEINWESLEGIRSARWAVAVVVLHCNGSPGARMLGAVATGSA